MRFNYKIFIADIIGFVLLYFLLLAVSPLSAPQPYTKYAGILGLYAACVMVFCAMSGRYTKRLKFLKFRYSTIQYVSASAISYLLVLMLCIYAFQGYSLAVVSTYAIICVCTVIVIQTGYFAYYYASDPEVVQEVAPREPKQVLYAATEADEKTKEQTQTDTDCRNLNGDACPLEQQRQRVNDELKIKHFSNKKNVGLKWMIFRWQNEVWGKFGKGCCLLIARCIKKAVLGENTSENRQI